MTLIERVDLVDRIDLPTRVENLVLEHPRARIGPETHILVLTTRRENVPTWMNVHVENLLRHALLIAMRTLHITHRVQVLLTTRRPDRLQRRPLRHLARDHVRKLLLENMLKTAATTSREA